MGRAVLLDYWSWREAQKDPRPYDPFDSTSIPLEDLKSCLAAQGTELKFGDILFIRSGKPIFCFFQIPFSKIRPRVPSVTPCQNHR
jgi:hypothetical protein